MRTLAIDIGGTKFSLALFDGDRLLQSHREPTDRDGGPEPLLERVIAVAGDWTAAGPFDRCGVSFGGPVDFARQRVVQSTHVAGWRDFDLAGRLADAFGVPVTIDNDANCGALGEARHGVGRDADPLFYVTLSTGIGGGLVVGGRPLRGADSYAGELGHMPVRPDGPVCLCGSRGCLERLCGGLWLERDHGRSARQLMRDPAFVARYVVDLALGLKSVLMLVNPARVAIGGGIAKAGDALFEPLRAELARQMTDWSRARIDVVPAQHIDDAPLWGAMELEKSE